MSLGDWIQWGILAVTGLGVIASIRSATRAGAHANDAARVANQARVEASEALRKLAEVEERREQRELERVAREAQPKASEIHLRSASRDSSMWLVIRNLGPGTVTVTDLVDEDGGSGIDASSLPVELPAQDTFWIWTSYGSYGDPSAFAVTVTWSDEAGEHSKPWRVPLR